MTVAAIDGAACLPGLCIAFLIAQMVFHLAFEHRLERRSEQLLQCFLHVGDGSRLTLLKKEFDTLLRKTSCIFLPCHLISCPLLSQYRGRSVQEKAHFILHTHLPKQAHETELFHVNDSPFVSHLKRLDSHVEDL